MKLATTVLLLALSLALGAAPAQAELYSHNDATRDVLVAGCAGEDTSECPSEAAVDQSVLEGDIIRANIRHQSHRVLVRIRERQVSAAGYRDHLVRIVTNEGVQRWVSVHAYAGTLQPSVVQVYNGRGEVIRCPNAWAGADSSTDLVTVIVPRRCLSYPRWVRVGVGSQTQAGEFTEWRYDDLMKVASVSDTLALSPRIRRG